VLVEGLEAEDMVVGALRLLLVSVRPVKALADT